MTLALRPYQREAIDALYSWFNDNDGNPLVVIPPGAGKSLVIATFIREALEAWPDTRVLVLTHVKELISQNFQELLGFWPDAPAGIQSAGLGKRDLHSRILFAGIQSIHKHAVTLQRVDLVLVDEAHLIPRNADTMYGRFLDQLRQINPYIKIVGFTATPYRLDSGMLHKGEGAVFSDVAYDAGIRDVIEQGYLTQPITQDALARINTDGIGTRGGEFIAGQLARAASDPEAVEAIAGEIVEAGRDRKGWIVFGCGVEHCTMLRDALRDRGVTCEAIYGKAAAADRDSIIAAFKRQEIQALVSVAVLTTGFNARHVDLIAIARPTKSVGLYIQMVGRGTRLSPGKTDCLVLDFGGNAQRHGPIDAPRVKAPGTGDADMPEKQCKDRVIGGFQITGCDAFNLIAAGKCISCGQPFARESKVDLTASAAAILTTHIKPEWLPVTDVMYRRHEKPGKPPSLCVTYLTGFNAHREWSCFEHTGPARMRAVQWWQKRAPATRVPNTVAEAMDNLTALRKPTQILVRKAGKYTEIVGVSFEPITQQEGSKAQ